MWNDTDDFPCFGLDRRQDERFLAFLLKRLGDDALMSKLLPRLDEEEMEALVDLFSRILRRCLTHGEYHDYFLSKDGS